MVEQSECGWMIMRDYCSYDIEPPGGCRCPYDSIEDCPVHNIDKK